MWRCLNDVWGYCKDEPTCKRKPKEVGIEGKIFTGGECKLDPKSCGRYLSLSQQLEGKHFISSGERVKKGRIVKVKEND